MHRAHSSIIGYFLVRQCPGLPGRRLSARRVADARVRQLRSADTRTLAASRTHSSFGDSTFAAAGPEVWNSLPPNLRLCWLSYGQFRRLLKTFLFGQRGGHGAACTVFNSAEWNYHCVQLNYVLLSSA